MTGNDRGYVYNDFDQKPDPPHQPYYLDEVLRRLKELGHGARILDAGCGGGGFAESVAESGYVMYGLDLSSSGIRAATARGIGTFVESSLYEDLTQPFDVDAFDAVYAVEVVEHLYSPQRFVECVFDALRPGGLFLVTTPYWGYLKNVGLALSGRMDNALTALWEGGHIKHFSRTTLSTLLTRSGFEVIAFRGAGVGIRAHLPYLWSGMLMTARKPLTAESR